MVLACCFLSSLSECLLPDALDLSNSRVGVCKGLCTLDSGCGAAEVVPSVVNLVVGACVVVFFIGLLPLKRRLWKPGFRFLQGLPTKPPDSPGL